MPSTNMRRSLSFLLALVMVFSLLPMHAMAEEMEIQSAEETTAAETTSPIATTGEAEITEATEPGSKENALLVQLQADADEILKEYLKTTDMSAEEIQKIVDSMDFVTYQTARSKHFELSESLRNAVESGEVSTEERNKFFNDNETLLIFSDILDERYYSENDVSFYANGSDNGTISGEAGNVSVSMTWYYNRYTGNYGSGVVNGNSVTITSGTQYSSSTSYVSEVTLTNSSTVKATLSFNYSASGTGSFSLSADTGTWSEVLEPGGYVTLSIWGKNWSYGVKTLELTNISLVEAKETSAITFNYDESLGTVKVDGTAVTSGTKQDVSLEDGAVLTAETKNSSTFLGWINEDTGAILSKETSYTLKPTDDMTVKAVFAGTADVYFMVGQAEEHRYSSEISYEGINLGEVYSFTYYTVSQTRLFDNLDDAITAAENSEYSKVIVPLVDVTLTKDYTIPAGVTLLIPFDDNNTLYTTAAESTSSTTTPTSYRTVTLDKNVKLTIEGTLSLSAKHRYVSATNAYGSSPVGKVSFVDMEEGSSITVNDGGALYAYGFISGSGTVTANSGATIYELFSITDFRGGKATTAMEGAKTGDDVLYKVFPFSQYYVQNIQVPLTICKDATERAFTTVSLSNAYMGADVGFIASSNAMFTLQSGYVTKTYDGSTDRLSLDLNGNVTLSSVIIQLTDNWAIKGMLAMAGLPSEINSANYVLPLNGNMTINLKSGYSATVNQDLALLPGTQITIEQNATVSLGSGYSVYVYDSAEWGAYCGSYNRVIVPLGSVPGRTHNRSTGLGDQVDASILVNGILDTSAGYLYTTSGGAEIWSEGTGVVKVNPGTATVTYQATQTSNEISAWNEIPITPAKLLNGDGTYTESSKAAGTYKYINGKWYKTVDIVSSNIAVNDGLDMWFYVNYDDVGANNKGLYKAVVTKYFLESYEAPDRDENPVVKTISGIEWEPYDTDDADNLPNYYRFRFTDIAAKEMTDQIEAVIYLNDDTDTQVSNTYEQTVQNYAITVLDAYKADESAKADQLRIALIDMLEYGAAAQNHFGYYDKENPVMANVDPEGSTTIADHKAKNFISTVNPDCPNNKVADRLTGVTISATNRLMYTFYFTIEDTTNIFADVTYTHRGNEEPSTYTVQSDKFYQRSATLYGVDVPELYFVDGFQLLTCNLYHNEGTPDDRSDDTLLGSGQDSVAGYAGRNKESSAIYMAMMRFVQSAITYFA